MPKERATLVVRSGQLEKGNCKQSKTSGSVHLVGPRQRACRQRSHRNEAIVAEGEVTRRHRVAMSANHTQGRKQKENSLRIGRDALID
jgi:hypothetical protein